MKGSFDLRVITTSRPRTPAVDTSDGLNMDEIVALLITEICNLTLPLILTLDFAVLSNEESKARIKSHSHPTRIHSYQ